MATVIVCDRCNDEIHGDLHKLSHPDLKRTADVCTPCMQTFLNWWKGKDSFPSIQDLRARAFPILPGWTCTKCGAFNGEAKENRLSCRSCEANYDGAR